MAMFKLVSGLAAGIVGCFALLACDPDSNTSDAGSDDPTDAGEVQDGDPAAFECTVSAPTECPDPPPRYADVEPIFKQRCAPCHGAKWDGPWPLDTYAHVADWSDVIRAHLIDCSMPPPEAGTPLPVEESETILAWIRCNTPR
jgi:hypothetical protein